MATTLGTPTEKSITLIATSKDGLPLGYIHAHPGKDESRANHVVMWQSLPWRRMPKDKELPVT
jgi:hypothetical protein